MIPKSGYDVIVCDDKSRRDIVCIASKEAASEPMHLCACCKRMLPKADFLDSMWDHKSRQNAYCKTCCHPPCSAPHCKTCPICRDPACRKRTTCTATMVPLSPKQMPKSKEDVLAYLCAQCRPITCKVCRREMALRTQQRKRANNDLTDVYICGTCLTLEENNTQQRKNTTQPTRPL